MHCVISSRFFFIFYFQCFHYHCEVFSTYLWLLPIYIWCHSEALFTGTWLFIWWSGHFIRVASTSQYFINIFLWSHWASPKNGRGGRNSNLDAQHIACMCENVCWGSIPWCTYILLSSVFSLTTFSASTVPCVPKALSFLGSVLQISLLLFGVLLHGTQVVPLFLWSITFPPTSSSL